MYLFPTLFCHLVESTPTPAALAFLAVASASLAMAVLAAVLQDNDGTTLSTTPLPEDRGCQVGFVGKVDLDCNFEGKCMEMLGLKVLGNYSASFGIKQFSILLLQNL